MLKNHILIITQEDIKMKHYLLTLTKRVTIEANSVTEARETFYSDHGNVKVIDTIHDLDIKQGGH